MKLSRRESTMIWTGALILVLILFYLLLIEPMVDGQKDKTIRIAKKKEELIEIRELAMQYNGLKTGRGDMEGKLKSRGPGFSPFSFLENLAGEAGLTGRIESMTPVAGASENGGPVVDEFDLRITGIGLSELVNFIYRLESSENGFFVINLNIRPRYLTPETIDVSLRVASPKAS